MSNEAVFTFRIQDDASMGAPGERPQVPGAERPAPPRREPAPTGEELQKSRAPVQAVEVEPPPPAPAPEPAQVAPPEAEPVAAAPPAQPEPPRQESWQDRVQATRDALAPEIPEQGQLPGISPGGQPFTTGRTNLAAGTVGLGDLLNHLRAQNLTIADIPGLRQAAIDDERSGSTRIYERHIRELERQAQQDSPEPPRSSDVGLGRLLRHLRETYPNVEDIPQLEQEAIDDTRSGAERIYERHIRDIREQERRAQPGYGTQQFIDEAARRLRTRQGRDIVRAGFVFGAGMSEQAAGRGALRVHTGTALVRNIMTGLIARGVTPAAAVAGGVITAGVAAAAAVPAIATATSNAAMNRIQGYSPELTYAQAMHGAAMTLQKLQSAQRLGPMMAQIQAERTRADLLGVMWRDNLAEALGPTAQNMAELKTAWNTLLYGMTGGEEGLGEGGIFIRGINAFVGATGDFINLINQMKGYITPDMQATIEGRQSDLLRLVQGLEPIPLPPDFLPASEEEGWRFDWSIKGIAGALGHMGI